jgi:hypothetical protein
MAQILSGKDISEYDPFSIVFLLSIVFVISLKVCKPNKKYNRIVLAIFQSIRKGFLFIPLKVYRRMNDGNCGKLQKKQQINVLAM